MNRYNREQKPASQFTTEVNRSFYDLLDFSDKREFECAKKNLIDAPEHLTLKDENGKIVWDQTPFEFLRDESHVDDTINPSLWVNSHLNHQYGLFEVTDGIYQVRGYDMCNFTVVRGETGWIVFDPLTCYECAKASMELVNKNLGEHPVTAVIISHPHADHFGGIRAVVDEEDIVSGKVPLIVPENFLYHALSEFGYTMNAVRRRASYQYGANVDAGRTGTLALGIGMGQSKGLVHFIRPTEEIKTTGEKRVLDGVEFVFQMTPETEAPAEMCWYMPGFKALWMAELCNSTMHNVYTLRGTLIRNANVWASYIFEAMQLFGKDAEVVFVSHNWPHWGNRELNEYMENTAAVYKFINDQSALYFNNGYTPNELSHKIRLPKPLEGVWYTRQYYGTLSHNAKAVYQRFLGWYDANPVNLNPLTPAEEGLQFLRYMGGAEAILEKASEDFRDGNYQWVAKVTNAIVFADPSNEQARLLCADACEQLGYQSECGPWRNCYLTAAYELRNGTTNPDNQIGDTGELLRCMESAMLLDYLGMILDGEACEFEDIKLNINVTDTDEKFYVHLYKGALLYCKNACEETVDATLTLPRIALAAIIGKDEALQEKLIQMDGDQTVLTRISKHITVLNPCFNVIEP